MKIKLLLTSLLLGVALAGFSQKNPLKEYVSNIPDGRNILIQPQFHNPHHVTGKIAIDFTIDKKGDVVMVMADRHHTTIKDEETIRECEAAVKEAKFSKLKKGKETQNARLSFAF